jgi:hypothetical protein
MKRLIMIRMMGKEQKIGSGNKNRAVYEVMWKTKGEPDRPQITL